MCGIGSLHDKLIINKGLLVLKNVIQFLKVTPLQNVDYLDKIGSNFSGFWLFCCSFLDSRWRPMGYTSSLCSRPSFSSRDWSVKRICATTASRYPSFCWAQGQCGEFKTQIIQKYKVLLMQTNSGFASNHRPALFLHSLFIPFRHLRYQTQMLPPILCWSSCCSYLPQAWQKHRVRLV